MNLVLGVLFLWCGAALLWVATHGGEQGKDAGLATPYDIFKTVVDEIGAVNR